MLRQFEDLVPEEIADFPCIIILDEVVYLLVGVYA